MSTDSETFEFGEEPDDGYVGEDDLLVERDETGDLIPVEKDVPQLGGKVKVKPMSYGKVRKLFGDEQFDEISPETIVQILNEHVVRPDLSGMTEEEIAKSMKPMAPNFLILAVLEASGVSGQMEVDEQGEAEMELELGNS